jgi:catechol 2,3-dioxygenase-like lactoylglutathione lyase family enzyme
MVKELSFVAYYVRDVARARRFYGEVLGLKPGEWFNEQWIEFDLGNATFALDGTGEELGITPGTSAGAAFEVDDIAEIRRRLVEAGAEATEVYEFPPCWTCFARDPEGNRFALHQRKAG